MDSTASSERRNGKREPNERKVHGHRTDILFKCVDGEVGCSEVGKKDDGDHGSKELRELGLKVPKMMKDQMRKLACLRPESRSHLAIIGFVIMGK